MKSFGCVTKGSHLSLCHGPESDHSADFEPNTMPKCNTRYNTNLKEKIYIHRFAINCMFKLQSRFISKSLDYMFSTFENYKKSEVHHHRDQKQKKY